MKYLPTVTLIAICVIGAILSSLFYNQNNQLKSETLLLGKRIEQANDQIADIEAKNKKINLRNKSMKDELPGVQTIIETHKKSIEAVREKREVILQRIEEARSKWGGMQKLYEHSKGLLSDKERLTGVLSDLNIKLSRLNAEVLKEEAAKRDIEEQIKKYSGPKEEIELEKIIVRMSNIPKGSILEVNKRYGFIIIDLGSQDGLMVGDIMGVYRNNRLISKVIVEMVFDDMASAVPLEGYSDIRLITADKVCLLK